MTNDYYQIPNDKFDCDLTEGKDVDALIRDPGLVIHQGNMQEMALRMWNRDLNGLQIGNWEEICH